MFFDLLKFTSLQKYAVFAGAFLSGYSSHANLSSEPGASSSVSSFGPPLGKSSIQGGIHSLGFDYSGYPLLKDDGVQSPRDKTYPSLNFHWQEIHRGPVFEAAGETAMQFTYHEGGHSAFFFEIPEAYVGTSESLGSVQFKVGRKLEHWNQLDETWVLGIWQPRFRWDYIRPEIVGLTGAFFSIQDSALKLTVMGSPGFIPERGVQVAVENGAVISRSPWFLPPPSEISILNRKTSVEYNLVLPHVSDILKQSSVSVNLKVGEEQGPWVAAGYAYKPMNQLLLAYDGYLQLNREGDKVANATVYPRLLHHHLTSFEAGFSESKFKASVSALSERPVRDQPPTGWTTQEVESALSVSPSLDIEMNGAADEPVRLGFSYLRVWGGSAPDGGAAKSLGALGGSVFESRYPFAQAGQMSVKTTLAALHRSLSWGRRVSFDMRLLHDIPNQGTILSWELRYRPQFNLELALGADILGTLESDRVSSNATSLSGQATNFIDRYRSNDRFHAGISYVF